MTKQQRERLRRIAVAKSKVMVKIRETKRYIADPGSQTSIYTKDYSGILKRLRAELHSHRIVLVEIKSGYFELFAELVASKLSKLNGEK